MPQTLQALRPDYDSLKAVKPDIILTTATAYGRGGPYSESLPCPALLSWAWLARTS